MKVSLKTKWKKRSEQKKSEEEARLKKAEEEAAIRTKRAEEESAIRAKMVRELSGGAKPKKTEMIKITVGEFHEMKRKIETAHSQIDEQEAMLQKIILDNQKLLESNQIKDKKIYELGQLLLASSSFFAQQKQEYIHLTRQLASLQEELSCVKK